MFESMGDSQVCERIKGQSIFVYFVEFNNMLLDNLYAHTMRWYFIRFLKMKNEASFLEYLCCNVE
jgi:hypothetical protein